MGRHLLCDVVTQFGGPGAASVLRSDAQCKSVASGKGPRKPAMGGDERLSLEEPAGKQPSKGKVGRRRSKKKLS